MESSPLASLLVRARGHELAAGRRLWVVAALLAGFHLAVVTPFVASSQRREAASQELERLDGVAFRLSELEPQLAQVASVVEEVMVPALDALQSGVGDDLLRLRATRREVRERVAAARGLGTAGSEPGDAEADTSRGGVDPAGEDELAGVEPFLVDNVDLVLAIADAVTRDEIVAALTPVVEEHIVHPRFSALRELWRSGALPRVEAALDGVAAVVPDLRGRFNAAAEAWDAFGAGLSAQRRAVRDLRWEPPERDDWWASSEPATGEEVALRLDPSVGEQLRRPLAYDQFQATAAQTEAAYRQVVSDVERRAEQLRLEVESAGLPAFVSGLGLVWIVRAFPLFVGGAMAVMLGAAARRRRELGLLVQLLRRRTGCDGLGEWYFLRSLWGMTAASVEHAQAAAWRASCLRTVFWAVVGFGWIALAAKQLRGVESSRSLLAAVAAGAVGLLAAIVYDVVVARSLHVLLRAPAGAVANGAGEAAADDDEVLDGHALRR